MRGKLDFEACLTGSLARTARVRVQIDLADALDKAAAVLGKHQRGHAVWEGDMPVKVGPVARVLKCS